MRHVEMPPRSCAWRALSTCATDASSTWAQVEEIVESRHVSGVEEFLVKWMGWPLEDATWEVEETLAGCTAAIRAWRRQQEAAREQDAAGDGATRDDGPPGAAVANGPTTRRNRDAGSPGDA